MTVPVAVLGSTSSHGGQMVSASGVKLQTNKGPACVQGDLHQCPVNGHGTTAVSSGLSTRVSTQGKGVVVEGSVAGCGAVINGNFASNIGVV